jgi:hypothetical protein
MRLLVAAGFVLGALLGGLAGRLTAPSTQDRVDQARAEAAQVSAQLRVLSLHAEANVASLRTGGDAGAGLGLRRAEDQLATALGDAPWIPQSERANLRDRLAALSRAEPGQAADSGYGASIDQLATDIDHTFGIGG